MQRDQGAVRESNESEDSLRDDVFGAVPRYHVDCRRLSRAKFTLVKSPNYQVSPGYLANALDDIYTEED